jgi:hypothetical protein
MPTMPASRWFCGIERKARPFAADEEHLFPDAGADRIHGDDRTRRLALGVSAAR